MSAYDLSRYLSWFRSYIEDFYFGTEEDVASINLKRDHSLRVLQEAARLTASLQLTSPMADVVHIAALFHDVGRFPQYRHHGTYNDRKSLDHARSGFAVMRGSDILGGLLPEHRKLVLGAVFFHNRPVLPPRLSSAQALTLRIIQDADKLDIIPTVMTNLDPRAPSSRVVSLGLLLDSDRYSEAVFNKIVSRQPVDMSEMIWLNDFKLMLLGWLLTLNFPASRQAVLERRYPQRLLALLPPRQELLGLGDAIHAFLATGRWTPTEGRPTPCREGVARAGSAAAEGAGRRIRGSILTR